MNEDDRESIAKGQRDKYTGNGDDPLGAKVNPGGFGGGQLGGNPQNDDDDTGGPEIPNNGDAIKGAGKKIGEKFDGAKEKAKEGINNAKEALGGAAEKAKEVGGRVAEGAKNIGGDIKDAAENVGEAVKDKVGEKVGDAKRAVGEKITDTFQDYVNMGEYGEVRNLNPDGEGIDNTPRTDDPVNNPESTAANWNHVMGSDRVRSWAIGEAQRQARMAQKEKRHMAYMNAAKAMAPQLAAAGIKSYADMLSGVRTLTNNFLSGQGMSTASTLLGETLSSADTAGDLMRRSGKDFGILQNADMEAIKDTAKGRMMMARNKAEQQGVAFANVVIGKALTDPVTEERKDISQLEMGDVVRVYNECRAGMTRAQQIMQDPKSTKGDKQHAAGMLQQYKDVVKGLDSRNKELGKMAREQAAYNTTKERDNRRARKEQSAAELRQRYDNATDAQKWVWDQLGNRSGIDLDDDGVPRKPTQIPGIIKTLDARISELEAAGEGPSTDPDAVQPTQGSPEYQMLTQLREKALAKQAQFRQPAQDRAREANMNEDGTEGGSTSRRRLIQNRQAFINHMMNDFGVPIDGRSLSEIAGGNDSAAQAAQALMSDPDFIRYHNEITLAENANIAENLQNRLTKRDPTLGIDPEMAEAIRTRLKEYQLEDKRTREKGGYVSPDSDFRAYADFYNEILDRKTANALDKTNKMIDTREEELDREGMEYTDDDEWNALRSAKAALENLDPGDDPAQALMERDVAMAQVGVDLKGARAARREAAAKEKLADRQAERKQEQDRKKVEQDQKKAEDAKNKAEAKAKARHEKACKGKMGSEEYRQYINELTAQRDAAKTRDKPKVERAIKAVQIGQSIAETKKRLGSIPMSEEQRSAVLNHLENIGGQITDRLAARGKGNYQTPQATLDEFTRVCEDVQELSSPMNAGLRARTRRELENLRFEGDSTEKELLQSLYDTLTSPPNLTSTWGHTDRTKDLIDKAANDLREYRAQEKAQAMEDKERSTDPSPTKASRKAARDLAISDMHDMLARRFGGRELPLSPREIRATGIADAEEIVAFMTSDPEYIRTHNRFMNNQNRQLWEDIKASIDKKSFLGMDNIDYLSLMNDLQNAYNRDYESRKDNDRYIEEDENSFGTIASAYRDVFHARLDALNDKNDISLRALEDRLKAEDADTSKPLSERSKVYRLTAMLKDALEDTEITPQNVREKAENIRDLRAGLIRAREEERAAERKEKEKKSKEKAATAQPKKKKEPKNNGVPNPSDETPVSSYIEGLKISGQITEAEEKVLNEFFKKAAQRKSPDDLVDWYNSLHNKLNSTSDPAKRKTIVNMIELVQSIAKKRRYSGGKRISPEDIQRMQADIDSHYKLPEPPKQDVPPAPVEPLKGEAGEQPKQDVPPKETWEQVAEDGKPPSEFDDEGAEPLTGKGVYTTKDGKQKVRRNREGYEVFANRADLTNISPKEFRTICEQFNFEKQDVDWVLKNFYKYDKNTKTIHIRGPKEVSLRGEAKKDAQSDPTSGEFRWSQDPDLGPTLKSDAESMAHYRYLAGDSASPEMFKNIMEGFIKKFDGDPQDPERDYALNTMNSISDPNFASRIGAKSDVDVRKVQELQKKAIEAYAQTIQICDDLQNNIEIEMNPKRYTPEQMAEAGKRLAEIYNDKGYGSYAKELKSTWERKGAEHDSPQSLTQGEILKVTMKTLLGELTKSDKSNPYMRRFFINIGGSKK